MPATSRTPARVPVDRRSSERGVDRDAARARDCAAPGAAPSSAALAARGGVASLRYFDATQTWSARSLFGGSGSREPIATRARPRVRLETRRRGQVSPFALGRGRRAVRSSSSSSRPTVSSPSTATNATLTPLLPPFRRFLRNSSCPTRGPCRVSRNGAPDPSYENENENENVQQKTSARCAPARRASASRAPPSTA